jgi:DNA processing protein
MSTPDDLPYWLSLIRIPDLGPRGILNLLKKVPHIQNLFSQPLDFYMELGINNEMSHYLRTPDWREIEADLAWEQKDSSHHILTLSSPEYPPLLLETPDPPPVLFVWGEVAVLTKPQLAMVGSRKASPQGKEIAYQLALELTGAGLTIISGLALGIDTAAHLGALAKDKTIAVIGSGIDVLYPHSNRHLAERISQQGAILSELTLGKPPLPEHFPKRNRIISGLSRGTMVVEANLKSGSLITARLANEQGRDVFAIPGSIFNPGSSGCHALIKQGAKLVENATDVLEEFSMLEQKSINKPHSRHIKPNNTLEEGHLKLLECFSFEPTKINILVARSHFSVQMVTSLLIDLELAGYVCSTFSGYMRVYE